MKRLDNKRTEIGDLPLPHGWQVSATYYVVWWLAMVFTTGAGQQLRSIVFTALVALAVLSVGAIAAFETLRWRRDRHNEDSVHPPT